MFRTKLNDFMSKSFSTFNDSLITEIISRPEDYQVKDSLFRDLYN